MSLQRLTSNESLYGRNLIAYPVQLIVKNSKIILLKLINCLRRHMSYAIVFLPKSIHEISCARIRLFAGHFNTFISGTGGRRLCGNGYMPCW